MARRFRATVPLSVRATAIGAAFLVLCVSGCSGDGQALATNPSFAATAPSATATSVALTVAPTSAAPSTTEAPAPVCVVVVQPGETLAVIAARVEGATVTAIEEENGLDADDFIYAGTELDICFNNDIDDVTGTSRLEPSGDAVITQQGELNDLFEGYSLERLGVDGDAGPLTRQMLCAARMGLGMRVHNGFLPVGSEEEATIFAATELSIPAGAPTSEDKWILIDKTCQVIVTGEGDDRIIDIYPTSTGEEGYETADVRAKAFRYDPAFDNAGWHDSVSFPVEIDNPLSGNMYKPIYFNEGQAVHGAGYIPPEPRSKGCARTFPAHQDAIVAWLGLDQLTEATWVREDIGVTVVVQGRFQPRD